MKSTITLLLFMISMALYSQTEVTGNQSGTWQTNGSPYLVIGDITVPTGETLSIEPGVQVIFQGHYQFKVKGLLMAQGTETDSIVFTCQNTSTGWGGIRIDGNMTSSFQYCRFEHGKTEGDYPDVHGGAVALLNADASFEHCVFKNNTADTGEDGMGGAIYALNAGSQTYFNDCQFISNYTFGEGGAIKFSGGNGIQMTRCEFIGNHCKYGGGAISCYSVAQIKMSFCLFADNYTLYSAGGAVQTLGMDNNLVFENCTFYGNTANNGDGGAVSLAYASANFVNSIVYENDGAYSDNVYLDIAGFAEINYCNMPMPDGATGSNNINSNPLFVDPAGYDFHLQENSPCIDAGTDIGYDFLGNAPDMGCFEFDPATSINAEIDPNSIKIFPVPAKDHLTLQSPLSLSEIILTDASGKTIRSFKPDCHSIPLENIKTGAYFLKIKTEKGVIIKRFVVLK